MTATETESPIVVLAAKLQAMQEMKRDLIADTRRISFSADTTKPLLLVDLNGQVEEFGVTEHAHNQIGTHLDIPAKFYDRLRDGHVDLFAGLTNGLLSREPSKRMVRTMGPTVRAFMSDRYRPRDNYDLMEHLLPILGGYDGIEFKKCDLTETRMYVKAFLPSWEIPVTPKVGDVIRGGVIISNSEVGAGSLYIYPYTDRLICTNGMVHTDFGQRRIHVGRRIESTEEAYEFYSDATMQLDDAAFFAKCADTLRGCLNRSVFDAIASQMRDLAEIRIPGSPVDAVEVLAKRQGFSEGEKGSILAHLIEGGDLSAWGVVNAVTATARDTEDADRQTDLEITAGKMVSDPGWAWAQAVAA